MPIDETSPSHAERISGMAQMTSPDPGTGQSGWWRGNEPLGWFGGDLVEELGVVERHQRCC